MFSIKKSPAIIVREFLKNVFEIKLQVKLILMQSSSFLRHLDFQSFYTVKLCVNISKKLLLPIYSDFSTVLFKNVSCIFKFIKKCISIMKYTCSIAEY